ncbi:homoserine O-acetyltransferase family protein [Duncaniella muris]|uniref:homoserine O-acetyltransferase family protein n=1 Tax=Duncaniella muris TaxID=2094150 RepID=UPI002675EF92|nr:alpha/beta fold hydrolase [Duncaniella muris]
MINYYHHSEPFSLELGGQLDALRIAYHTYGTLNADKSNVIWVCHALKGKFLDPADNFIICANILGSPYGTTAPLHTNPATGSPYYKDFPPYTIRDIVNAHRLLAEALGIDRIKVLVGCSVGGFQAIEWAVMEPERFERLVLMATDAIATPWTIAIDETMRMSIEADPTFGDPDPQAGRKGLAAARAIGLLSYRGYYGYNLTQKDVEELPEIHRASSYQQYQGEKLCRRFDAYSYYAILKAFDTHNVGRGRGGLDAALKRIKARTLVVGLETDIVFPPREMQELCSKIPGAVYGEIHSPFGHDGFLVEYNQLNNLLLPFIKN